MTPRAAPACRRMTAASGAATLSLPTAVGGQMATAAPTTLIFADRRRDGAYAVLDQAGRTVARIRTGWGGGRFVAEDASGATLCAGSAGWWGMSNLWRATDAAGQPLLELRKSSVRSRGVVQLHR